MKNNSTIAGITKEIVDMCSPLRIYLVSSKTNSRGGLISFKLCVIVSDTYEKYKELESDILIKTNCDIPFDIIPYRISDWNNCLEDDCTFAYRIENAGELLYE